MAEETTCIFCSIAQGATPARVVFDGGDTLFFHDIAPKAKVHIVGIPKEHLSSLKAMQADHHSLMGKLLHDAVHVAKEAGVTETGFRLLTNVGPHAGQAVPHLHFHILGGEPLGPLRC